MTELRRLLADLDADATGAEMHQHVRDLYPICRSITGQGLRETLLWIQGRVPLDIHEIKTGTSILDWTVPREWNLRDAYIKDPSGQKVVDFRRLNLHVLGHSLPVKAKMTLDELRPHLFSLPDRPELVPYRTSYYTDAWGFCLSHNQLLSLEDGSYEVSIDSTLEEGSLSYGECLLPGQTEEEVLISTHVCHPSLANDNLSGIVVAAKLAQLISTARSRYTYRFLFVPGTIGAIAWLARNEGTISRIKHGLVISGVGDAGSLTYKRSRRGNTEIDRAIEHVLKMSGEPHRIIDFEPFGYDERQFCSPGFNLPVGNLSRTPHGTYPEYHTSADNPNFVHAESLFDSLAKCHAAFAVIESNHLYLNLKPKGEPQLGRRGLFGSIAGIPDAQTARRAISWVLSESDGSASLLDIAQRSGLEFEVIRTASEALHAAGLLSVRAEDLGR